HPESTPFPSTTLFRSYAPTAPEPRNMAAAGGKLFVVGSDPAHGAQLWVSDGTSAGTRRLTDTGVTVPYLTRNAELARLTPAGDRSEEHTSELLSPYDL